MLHLYAQNFTPKTGTYQYNTITSDEAFELFREEFQKDINNTAWTIGWESIRKMFALDTGCDLPKDFVSLERRNQAKDIPIYVGAVGLVVIPRGFVDLKRDVVQPHEFYFVRWVRQD